MVTMHMPPRQTQWPWQLWHHQCHLYIKHLSKN